MQTMTDTIQLNAPRRFNQYRRSPLTNLYNQNILVSPNKYIQSQRLLRRSIKLHARTFVSTWAVVINAMKTNTIIRFAFGK